MEELVYDASGQLVTGTLMDYALPRADGVPAVEIVRHDVPAPSNPLGVKGAGEAGTSGVGAALANAVANAVGPAAARHLPITASRVLAALDGTTPPSCKYRGLSRAGGTPWAYARTRKLRILPVGSLLGPTNCAFAAETRTRHRLHPRPEPDRRTEELED